MTSFVSGEVGLLKPSRELYEHLLAVLDTPAANVVLVDNRADNVVGAEGLGISSHQYSGHAELRRFLGQLART